MSDIQRTTDERNELRHTFWVKHSFARLDTFQKLITEARSYIRKNLLTPAVLGGKIR
jgi:hypothetical protein